MEMCIILMVSGFPNYCNNSAPWRPATRGDTGGNAPPPSLNVRVFASDTIRITSKLFSASCPDLPGSEQCSPRPTLGPSVTFWIHFPYLEVPAGMAAPRAGTWGHKGSSTSQLDPPPPKPVLLVCPETAGWCNDLRPGKTNSFQGNQR